MPTGPSATNPNRPVSSATVTGPGSPARRRDPGLIGPLLPKADRMFRILWAVIVIGLSALAWGGQTLSWLAPASAVRFGLMEAEADVEPAFWADVRGEVKWDAATLWVAVVAGVLLMIDHRWWAYFGLAGGGMYLYFAGRGILARLELRATRPTDREPSQRGHRPDIPGPMGGHGFGHHHRRRCRPGVAMRGAIRWT